jgi:hypothetical protein
VRFEQQTRDGVSTRMAQLLKRHFESLSNHSGLRALILLCKSNDNESLLVSEVQSLAEETGRQAAEAMHRFLMTGDAKPKLEVAEV